MFRLLCSLYVRFIFLVFCDVLFALLVFVLCFVNPMRLVSLDCLYLIAPSVFSDVYFINTEDTTTGVST
jgi:hypothetical protein